MWREINTDKITICRIFWTAVSVDCPSRN